MQTNELFGNLVYAFFELSLVTLQIFLKFLDYVRFHYNCWYDVSYISYYWVMYHKKKTDFCLDDFILDQLLIFGNTLYI